MNNSFTPSYKSRSGKSVCNLTDTYSSTVHSKLILVLHIISSFPHISFLKSVTTMIPVSLAENLDPPLTLSFLFPLPTWVHQFLPILLLLLLFSYPATGPFVYLPVSLTLVKVLTTLTIISSQAALEGRGPLWVTTLGQQVYTWQSEWKTPDAHSPSYGTPSSSVYSSSLFPECHGQRITP